MAEFVERLIRLRSWRTYSRAEFARTDYPTTLSHGAEGRLESGVALDASGRTP
jgi:hypothetical protein